MSGTVGQLGRSSKALVALVLALACGAGATFSGALQTSHSDNTSSLAAGSVRLTDSRAGAAVVNGTDMRPGDTRTGTLTLTNDGDVAAAVTLTATDVVSTPASPALGEVLEIAIEDRTTGSQTLWSGPLARFEQATTGTLAPAAQRTIAFTLSWPADENDAALQGARVSLGFHWSARS